MNGERAYELAYKYATHTSDGAVVEDSLVKLVAQLIEIDVDEQKLNLARRIVARRKRPGQTPGDGVLAIPGLEKFAYEPHRLIADDAGNVIENQHAKTVHKLAEARRAVAAAKSAGDRAELAAREAAYLDEWTEAQKREGRDPAALVWGACVREAGLLIEDAAGGAA